MSEEIAIATHALNRTYETRTGIIHTHITKREALCGIDLLVKRGEVFGLLGPNGAGKTTLVKILATILLPTSGSAEVLGLDVIRATNQVRRQIGVVLGGERGLYQRLTGRQLLRYWAALYHVPVAKTERTSAELLDMVGLADHADERVETYSRGMKQRLHLARGLIHHPEVLFLDEPTTGMDPVATLSTREIVRSLHKQGITIFLTTHNMQEAETLCDRVAFINHGQILLLDHPQVLTQTLAKTLDVEIVLATDAEELAAQVRALPAVQNCSITRDADTWMLQTRLTQATALAQILGLLGSLPVLRVTTKEPTLEDVYLHLLGDRKMRV